MPNAKIVIPDSKRRLIESRHPWIMKGSILPPHESIDLGDVVDLVDMHGNFLARGMFNPESRIAVRLYAWEPVELDGQWVRARLDEALTLRRMNPLARCGIDQAERLCFSEADGLSGLVIDRYSRHFVIQINAAVMLRFLESVVGWIKDRFDWESLMLSIDESIAKSEGLTPTHETVEGKAANSPITIAENGLSWLVDFEQGQKTGLYLDQSDNRQLVSRWCQRMASDLAGNLTSNNAGESSFRVADICCYSGGFGLQVASAVPKSVVTLVDSSNTALEIAQRNAELNSIPNVEFRRADFFDFLGEQLDTGQSFDAIILDPPKLAGSRNSTEQALRAYHRLNFLALRLLKKDGLLVSCSCSGRISRQNFRQMLGGAARHAKREMQVLAELGAAMDHPMLLSCPESEYLKVCLGRVR